MRKPHFYPIQHQLILKLSVDQVQARALLETSLIKFIINFSSSILGDRGVNINKSHPLSPDEEGRCASKKLLYEVINAKIKYH